MDFGDIKKMLFFIISIYFENGANMKNFKKTFLLEIKFLIK